MGKMVCRIFIIVYVLGVTAFTLCYCWGVWMGYKFRKENGYLYNVPEIVQDYCDRYNYIDYEEREDGSGFRLLVLRYE